MAQKVAVTLVDDMTGEEITDTEGGNIRFGLDGTDYEIDLAGPATRALRASLDPYIDHARVVRAESAAKGKSPIPRGARKQDNQAIREWARTQGIPVNDRGRIPASLMARYEAASF